MKDDSELTILDNTSKHRFCRFPLFCRAESVRILVVVVVGMWMWRKEDRHYVVLVHVKENQPEGQAREWRVIFPKCMPILDLSLKTNSFTFLNNMTKKNYAASSTVIGSQLWITGGCMNEDGKFDDACLQVNLSLAHLKCDN